MKKNILLLLLVSSLSHAKDHPNLSCMIQIETQNKETLSETLDIPILESSRGEKFGFKLKNAAMELQVGQANQNLFQVRFLHGEDRQELGSGHFDVRDADSEGKIVRFVSPVKNRTLSLECFYSPEEARDDKWWKEYEENLKGEGGDEAEPVEEGSENADDSEAVAEQSTNILSEHQIQMITQILAGRATYLEEHFVPSLQTALDNHKRITKNGFIAPGALLASSIAADIGIHELQGLPIGQDEFTSTVTALAFGASIVWGGVRAIKKIRQHLQDKKLLEHLKKKGKSALDGMQTYQLITDVESFRFDLEDISKKGEMTSSQVMEVIKIFNAQISQHLNVVFSAMERELPSLGNSETESFLRKIIPDVKKDEETTNQMIEQVLALKSSRSSTSSIELLEHRIRWDD